MTLGALAAHAKGRFPRATDFALIPRLQSPKTAATDAIFLSQRHNGTKWPSSLLCIIHIRPDLVSPSFLCAFVPL